MGYHRIYTAKAIEELFRQESNKSGLINDLLLKHYGLAEISQERRHYPERLDYKRNGTPIETHKETPTVPYKETPMVPNTTVQVEGLAKACCLSSTPCKHWVYKGEDGVWVNSLTGEVKAV